MHWNWRLRSPNSGNANNVRNVNSDGSENNNNAYNGNVGVLPLRWIYRDRVARAAKAEAHHQRKAYEHLTEEYLMVIDVDIAAPACCIMNGGVPDV